jgi:hypothetical protein
VAWYRDDNVQYQLPFGISDAAGGEAPAVSTAFVNETPGLTGDSIATQIHQTNVISVGPSRLDSSTEKLEP